MTTRKKRARSASPPGSSLPPPTSNSDIIEVKPSPGKGNGLFAKKNIPEGTRIWDYQGVQMNSKDFKAKYEDDTRYTYQMRRIHQMLVGKNAPYLTSNLVHYANESLCPNIYYKQRGVYTARNVKKGEELTLLYPKKYPRTYSLSGRSCSTSHRRASDKSPRSSRGHSRINRKSRRTKISRKKNARS